MSSIAILLGQDFEDVEFSSPHSTLIEHDHDVVVIGSETGEVTGKNAMVVTIDRSIDDVEPAEFDALVIPGGYSPDHLRTNPAMVGFTRSLIESDRPVAAVCHAPRLMS